jgi:hypothetical protein
MANWDQHAGVAIARMRSALGAACKLATLALLILHFVLTILYVLPPNPVKVPLLGLLQGTVGVYARQNWSLFAPNPIASNQAVLAKCMTAAESARESDAMRRGRATSGWADVSTPFWSAFQGNRFSAYDRVIRPYTHALRTYLFGGHALSEWESACRAKNDADACIVYEKTLATVRTGMERSLRRLGSAFCAEHRPDAAVVAVALRARLTPAWRWSERHNPPAGRPAHDVSLGVFPIDRSVVGPRIFRAAP